MFNIMQNNQIEAAERYMDKGEYRKALELLNEEIDFFLYKMMWGINSIKEIQELRHICYRKMRERK